MAGQSDRLPGQFKRYIMDTRDMLIGLPPVVKQMASLDFGYYYAIPETWFKFFMDPNNNLNLRQMLMLAEIVYWHRPRAVYHRDRNEIIGSGKRFKGPGFNRRYSEWGKRYGISEKQARRDLHGLEKAGLIKIKIATEVVVEGMHLWNVAYFEPVPERIFEITNSIHEEKYPQDEAELLPEEAEITVKSIKNVADVRRPKPVPGRTGLSGGLDKQSPEKRDENVQTYTNIVSMNIKNKEVYSPPNTTVPRVQDLPGLAKRGKGEGGERKEPVNIGSTNYSSPLGHVPSDEQIERWYKEAREADPSITKRDWDHAVYALKMTNWHVYGKPVYDPRSAIMWQLTQPIRRYFGNEYEPKSSKIRVPRDEYERKRARFNELQTIGDNLLADYCRADDAIKVATEKNLPGIEELRANRKKISAQLDRVRKEYRELGEFLDTHEPR